MRSKFRKLLSDLTKVIVLFGLVGCVISPSPTSVVNPANTAFSTASSPSPTLPRSATPTLNLAPTQQLLPPTAIPPLKADEASTEILRLLSAENTCEFPCWWGLVPGETRIVDAQNYLNTFNVLSVGTPKFDREGGYIWLRFPKTQNSYLTTILEFEGTSDVLDWLQVRIQIMHEVVYPEGPSYEISWADQELTEIIKPYSLSRVLATYGVPAEVLLFTYQVALLNQPWPVSLVVFYPEQGFMIEYVSDDRPMIKEPGIVWCPDLAFPYFWFWPPSANLTIKDVASLIHGFQLDYESVDSGRFRTLEEATGMNIDEFYSLYTTDENACINTPAELWPMPGQ